MTPINKADIYALYLLNGKKDDYKLNEYTWQNIFNMPPNGVTEKLIKNKLLMLTKDSRTALPQLLVPELKKILKNNKLRVSGKKQELITRILNNIDENKINSYINFKIFTVTDSGLSLLKKYSAIPIIAKYYDNNIITFKNAELSGVKNNDNDPKKVINTITNYFYNRYFSKKYWDKVHSVLICKENHGRKFDSVDEKINIYLQLIYLSLSGQSMNFEHETLIKKFDYLDSADDLKNYVCNLPEYYVDSIQKIESGTGMVDKDILEKFKEIENKFKSVDSIFSDLEMEKILEYSLEGNSESKINSIYSQKFNNLKSNNTRTKHSSILNSNEFNKKILIKEKHKIDNLLDEKNNGNSSSTNQNKKSHIPRHKKSFWSQLIDPFKKI